MTKGRENEGLFFMSREVIQFLKSGRSDLKIYPIFYDEYNVVKLGQPNVNSLYIQDVQELMNLVEDPSKKAVVFFNLFNGITLPGNEEERTYNGVISYTTWLNMYAGILDDADLFRGLIYTGSLKDDLLDCLMFLHFSRYEAVPRKDRPISFKLDPYDNIIGTDSVGPLALFPHMDSGARFNCLAFLTEVRRIVNLP